jgi:hypothetical protein
VRRTFVAFLCAALLNSANAAPVRFIDAATRFAIDPTRVEVTGAELRHGAAGTELAHRPGVPFAISPAGYRARSFAGIDADDEATRVFVLEPTAIPAEIEPANIARLHRADAMVILGYVGDAFTGQPLVGVSVVTGQGDVTATDARGYFQIYIPCLKEDERGALSFSKPGFRTQERTEIELFPNGDWIYRIQLERGHGSTRFVDRPVRDGVSAEEEGDSFGIASVGTNQVSVPRVPNNIRILHTNGVVYYETLENYCRHSLPSEWIASWGAYTGGSNSLNAGAVAVRTYAVGYVNAPRGTNHDICSTTSCQVYNPTFTHSRTDVAVSYTAGCVMVNSNSAIPRGLTEYSAENNQLGMACGDGFTAPAGGCLADPVCTGEAEFGHGRGLCQWGSARWATGLKFPNRSTSDNTTTNGFPRQDWRWILEHYYPRLRLVQASPLALGDPVRVIGSSTPLNVRSCPGGTITNGVNCPSLGTRPLGALGYIIGGPVRVTADGQGYTWWRVHWQNGLEGWSVENYLDRFIPTNTAPQITAVSDAAIHAGATFRITNSATDNDFPPNTLTFSLPVAPVGASVTPSTGILAWTSPVASVNTTNNFTVRVTDNGSPPLSATTSFRVRVVPPPQISVTLLAPGSVRLTWTAAAKSRYRVDYANDLNAAQWIPLGNILTASGATMTYTDTAPAQQRFYRITVID